MTSFVDGLGVGLGFTFSLTLLGVIRELFGSRSILNYQILPDSFEPWVVMVLPSGAFLTLGLVIGLVNYLRSRKRVEA